MIRTTSRPWPLPTPSVRSTRTSAGTWKPAWPACRPACGRKSVTCTMRAWRLRRARAARSRLEGFGTPSSPGSPCRPTTRPPPPKATGSRPRCPACMKILAIDRARDRVTRPLGVSRDPISRRSALRARGVLRDQRFAERRGPAPAGGRLRPCGGRQRLRRAVDRGRRGSAARCLGERLCQRVTPPRRGQPYVR